MESSSIRSNPLQALYIGLGLLLGVIALIALFSSSAQGWRYDWGKDQILVVACSIGSAFFFLLGTFVHIKG